MAPNRMNIWEDCICFSCVLRPYGFVMHFKNSSDHILFFLFSFGLLLDINFRSSLNIWSDEHLSQSKANVLAHTCSLLMQSLKWNRNLFLLLWWVVMKYPARSWFFVCSFSFAASRTVDTSRRCFKTITSLQGRFRICLLLVKFKLFHLWGSKLFFMVWSILLSSQRFNLTFYMQRGWYHLQWFV